MAAITLCDLDDACLLLVFKQLEPLPDLYNLALSCHVSMCAVWGSSWYACCVGQQLVYVLCGAAGAVHCVRVQGSGAWLRTSRPLRCSAHVAQHMHAHTAAHPAARITPYDRNST